MAFLKKKKVGNWLSPRAGLDFWRGENLLPLSEFEPRAVQPEA
jgi:hypothetical protein